MFFASTLRLFVPHAQGERKHLGGMEMLSDIRPPLVLSLSKEASRGLEPKQ